MNGNFQKAGGRNLILLILCILLFILFAGLLFWSRKTNAAETAKLEEMAEQTNDSQTEQTVSQEENQPTETAAGEGEAEEIQKEDSFQAKGIVCWGDDLINGEESAAHSYRAVLQNLLNENGYNLTVIDKTLQGAGTLSMMTMAGVPAEEVQSFITSHQEGAQGQELPVTETGASTGSAGSSGSVATSPVVCATVVVAGVVLRGAALLFLSLLFIKANAPIASITTSTITAITVILLDFF